MLAFAIVLILVNVAVAFADRIISVFRPLDESDVDAICRRSRR